MTDEQSSGTGLTGLILELFALNNRLLTVGDRLVAPLGLTSARWQVLGSIVECEQPQPVAWLARNMGANRQNIQRIVNDLAGDELVRFAPNPHHRRAQLVILTDRGRATYAAALELQTPWVQQLAAGLSEADIGKALAVLAALRAKLESAEPSAPVITSSANRLGQD